MKKEIIIGLHTKRYRAEWDYSGTRTCEGHVPNSVVKEGNDAILAWLWENGDAYDDEHSEYTPATPELIED